MTTAIKYGPAKLLPGEQLRITMNNDTEPFWQAAKERRLTACQCPNGHFRMPPGPVCPECSSFERVWPTLPGTGTIFSFAICNRNPATGEPYIYVPVAVDLDGAPGARLMSNVTGCDAEDVHIGMKVEVVWTEINDGWVYPHFRKA